MIEQQFLIKVYQYVSKCIKCDYSFSIACNINGEMKKLTFKLY